MLVFDGDFRCLLGNGKLLPALLAVSERFWVAFFPIAETALISVK
jgi:hypothetical protein